MGAYKVSADVLEVLAVLLQGLLEQVGLGGAPLLHFVATQHGSAARHQRRHGGRQLVLVAVQRVHGVQLRGNWVKDAATAPTHQSDVSTGGGGAHVQTGLPHGAGAVQGSGEGADTARDHHELVSLAVGQRVQRVPHQLFQRAEIAAIALLCKGGQGHGFARRVPWPSKGVTSAWKREPTRISPLSASSVFCAGS